MTKKISKENGGAYLRIGGSHCPHCGSPNVSTGGSDTMEGAMDVYCSCDECHEEWADRYHLVGVTNDVSEVWNSDAQAARGD